LPKSGKNQKRKQSQIVNSIRKGLPLLGSIFR